MLFLPGSAIYVASALSSCFAFSPCSSDCTPNTSQAFCLSCQRLMWCITVHLFPLRSLCSLLLFGLQPLVLCLQAQHKSGFLLELPMIDVVHDSAFVSTESAICAAFAVSSCFASCMLLCLQDQHRSQTTQHHNVSGCQTKHFNAATDIVACRRGFSAGPLFLTEAHVTMADGIENMLSLLIFHEPVAYWALHA